MFSNFVFSLIFLCYIFSINNSSSLKRLLAENESNTCPENDKLAIEDAFNTFRKRYKKYCTSDLSDEKWNIYVKKTSDLLSNITKKIYKIYKIKKRVLNSITDDFGETYYGAVFYPNEAKSGVRGYTTERTKSVIDAVCKGLYNYVINLSYSLKSLDNSCTKARIDYSGQSKTTGLDITGHYEFIKEENEWKIESLAETVTQYRES